MCNPPNFLVMWYVYVIQSKKDDNFYVGMINDLKRRIQQHNQGKSFATRLRTPFMLVYYEAHSSKYDAVARERFLKTGWGKNWIKRTLNNHLTKKLGG
ncbi:MAG: GIY-YIG nuclease family protein [Patescibacteria group bacterium]|nr:GIY-YIG nuclease family protein [Patescibacteria group bacterium]